MRLVIVGGIVALAVSASLTPANAGGGGNRPCHAGRIALDEWPCVCVSWCKGYGDPSRPYGNGKPWRDVVACAVKCDAAKKAARTATDGR